MGRYLIGAVLLAIIALIVFWPRLADRMQGVVPDLVESENEIVAQSASATVSVDPGTGLRMTGDWHLVRDNCVACHSAMLITQQRGSASQWLGIIRWMQAKQNLWQFDPDTEDRIIGYLAQNYPPQTDRRRAAIPLNLMPANPYPLEP